MTAFGEGTGMKRYFNTEGICKPHIHYMVRLDSRLEQMKRLYVDRGKYFTINRGRQYGKTTTLAALAEYLKDDYAVLSMGFQALSSECFADEPTFVKSFIEYLEEIVSGDEGLGRCCRWGVFSRAPFPEKGASCIMKGMISRPMYR